MTSIIVPVYNVEKYLREALDSIRRQTVADFEVILVDDGSTDGSGRICDEYAAADKRFRVVHQANAGQSAARNAGLDAASGEWIVFVDSDDVVNYRMLELLLALADSETADIAAARFIMGTDPRHFAERDVQGGGHVKVYDSVSAVREFLYQRGLQNSPCAKIYRRELFDNVRFREGMLYEDIEIGYRLMAKAKRVATIDSIVYFYRVRQGSTLHRFNPARFAVLDVVDEIAEFARTQMPAAVPAANDRRFSASCNMLRLLQAHKACTDYPEVEQRCRATIAALRGAILRDLHSRLRCKVAALLPIAAIKRL